MNGLYICLSTYNDEIEEYGIDFFATRIYKYKDGYMHSTENGTDVMIDEDELRQHWIKVE